jgi:NADPH2:quinone reductase
MRAVVCHAFGAIEALSVESVPDPVPGPGQLRLAVEAAGVNFADLLTIAGQYQEKRTPPFVPGLEAAGTVIDCGDGVDGLKPGERVAAVMDQGAFAEQAVARVEDVVTVPDEMDIATAAAFPLVYGTAYGALVWRAGLKAGETLLVTGAGGGAGLAAVEVGCALGASVIAMAGDEAKLALARERGARHVIDYRNEDTRARIKALAGGIDVAFDAVGGDAFDTALRTANWGARLLVIGFAGGRVPQIPANILLVKNVSAMGFYWGSYRRRRPDLVAEAWRVLLEWWREGRIRPCVGATFDLAEAPRALALLRDRHASGKVVLTTGPRR